MTQSLLFQTEPCRLPGYPAAWSPCRNYRYALWRKWTDEPEPPYVAWIGLNPSTATEAEDDPTLRRVMGFTRDWGYGAMCMLNLFGFRSTDPAVMKSEISFHALPLGCVIGRVYLFGCQGVEFVRGLVSEEEREFGDYSDGHYAWRVSTPLRHEPIAATGRLGLWDWEPPVGLKVGERAMSGAKQAEGMLF